VNEETITFLMKATIPIEEPDEVQEARRQRRARQNVKETKEETRSALQGPQSDTRTRPPVEKMAPVKSEKMVGRNEKVNVQYMDGRVVKDIKYKKVEEDIKNNKCVII
jgi:preprotein translocase subunit SecA